GGTGGGGGGEQMTREARDEVGELAVVHPAIALDHGDEVGVGGDRTVERRAESLARPVTASAIPLGDVGGPGHHALEWRRHGAIAYFTLASSLRVLSADGPLRAPRPRAPLGPLVLGLRGDRDSPPRRGRGR